MSSKRLGAVLAVVVVLVASDGRRPAVLIGGGQTDPNLAALVQTLRQRGKADVVEVYMGPNGLYPAVSWDMDADALHVEGVPLHVDSAFLRYDVFSWINEQNPTARANNQQRAANLHNTLQGWLWAHADSVRLVRRVGWLGLRSRASSPCVN